MKGITILGSTGSIGVSTLDVISQHPDEFELIALTANKDVANLRRQCLRYRPRYAVMADANSAGILRRYLGVELPEISVLAGIEGLEEVAVANETDYVMAAIVGAAGLMPTLAAAKAGKRVLLANKEALVMSGKIFMDAVKEHGAVLLPIDSEHNAIYQCMPADYRDGLSRAGVSRILLTASGGPFRDYPLDRLPEVTPDEACAHPNWNMGRKISVDSATMMNKGLEVIEACWLFDTGPDRIQVVLHPQSIIHSLVEYVDGSVLAQLGNPDMRTPIAHALAWPGRMASGVKPLDLFQIARLDFTEPDLDRFPCLRLAFAAVETGGTATAVLNAANEVAVEAFLQGQIRFTDIPVVVESALDGVPPSPAEALDSILRADQQARIFAASVIGNLAA
ncbi:MAG: 1-deoxy-D-xylulose-5-phosphate reductoisomerase [Gammaproteobacteria bacterium RIFCSPLOWO2_02_FULL_56_15]|nr:MAG: 1-deoxy-D-xylulose-5-phosphate reductoisomerase [Gammaproteobacteria bacterium RIFCSPLOWO2_02_FULL_56_15]